MIQGCDTNISCKHFLNKHEESSYVHSISKSNIIRQALAMARMVRKPCKIISFSASSSTESAVKGS